MPNHFGLLAREIVSAETLRMMRHLLLLPFMPFILFVAFLVAIFEIWMFVDVIVNPKLESMEKLLWIVAMLLFHPFVAIAYYFVARSKLPPRKRLR